MALICSSVNARSRMPLAKSSFDIIERYHSSSNVSLPRSCFPRSRMIRKRSGESPCTKTSFNAAFSSTKPRRNASAICPALSFVIGHISFAFSLPSSSTVSIAPAPAAAAIVNPITISKIVFAQPSAWATWFCPHLMSLFSDSLSHLSVSVTKSWYVVDGFWLLVCEETDL